MLLSSLSGRPKLQCVVADDDEDACAKALLAHRDTDFTWLQLTSAAAALASHTCRGPDGQAEKKKVRAGRWVGR